MSSNSYWHFRPPKVSIGHRKSCFAWSCRCRHSVPADGDSRQGAARFCRRAYLRKLQLHALLNGIDIICLSTHQTFVSPNPDEITRNVEHTNKCLEIAHELDAPCIRINTGRWDTSKDFDEL